MKTTALNTEKNESKKFAFLPEMVLEHLNDAKPTETTVENSNEPEVKKITITADPDIPNLDSIPVPESVSKKEEIKPIETVEESDLETAKSEAEENLIKRFINKIKIY
ncbi:hypothetical protein C8C85_1875 [Flavobacterium sp. 103]|uniref:hypothetical protein n=1 Tax=unclassified Flavobacterium TaxID=196869 RepID=UPI000D5FA46F|nr:MULTISPECIES: hypothetical protein [unclassified Flavobacterium]PVX46061.1 hypothetical protein C8C85_1875 [Flavobacterium sp. 103]QKJ61813.1 hypothetical protein HQN62_01305 [Flavobacterium sp. M31R6]